MINQALEDNHKDVKIHLLFSYVLFYKHKNLYKSMYELIQAKSSNVEFFDMFQIFRFSKILEKELVKRDDKLNEERTIDVNFLVRFNGIFVEFQVLLSNITMIFLEFFRELCEKIPDMKILDKFGSLLISMKKKSEERF